MNKEIENYSWGIVQDMIEREVNSAFKLREPTKMPSKKEIKQIIKHTLQSRMEELSPNKPSPKTQVEESERMAKYIDESSMRW